jgi:3-oxoadipate enol-lactonase
VRGVRAWRARDVVALCHRNRARTLVVTGERHLDRVVPFDSTREYVDLIPGARHAVLAGTGHVGLVSKPDEFARLVGDFIDAR